MLTIFRRHLANCKHRPKGRKHRSCNCPISVEGILRGKAIRTALDTRSWEGAQATVREWETLGGVTGEAVSMADAIARYLADCHARNLKPATIDKQRLFLHRHFAPLRLIAPALHGYKSVKHLVAIEPRRGFRPGFADRQTRAHPRGRVALEERGRGLPGWAYRWIYRALFPPTLWCDRWMERRK